MQARDDGVRLTVDISDRGIGIEGSELENVFKPFYRTDGSRTRSTGGVGLGLTLAHRIIEAHNGTITLESTFGQGTTVTCSVPHLKGQTV